MAYKRTITRKRRGNDDGDTPSKKSLQSLSISDSGHSNTETDCSMCEEIVTNTERAGTVITMHVDIKTISPLPGKTKEEKGEKRDKKQNENRRIMENVCALRNTNGGCLVIYFKNMESSDRFLGDLDELVDDRLQELIEDGKLFSESYHRQWHKTYKHCLCITCNPSTAISTLDYNAKMSLNKGFGRFTAFNIRHILASSKPPPICTKIDLHEVQEQSNIQLKSFRNHTGVELKNWATHIMEDLRLREYIAAFANQRSGGYYLLGIAEKEDNSSNYHRKSVTLEGFPISETKQRELQSDILKLVKKRMLWVDRYMKILDNEIVDNAIKFTFHELKDGSFIMEVFIYPVQGIVFHDKSGPISLKLSEHNKPIPIDIKIWLQKILQISMPTLATA